MFISGCQSYWLNLNKTFFSNLYLQYLHKRNVILNVIFIFLPNITKFLIYILNVAVGLFVN